MGKKKEDANVQNSQDEERNQKKEWWTCGNTLTLLGFGTFFIQYALRVNISVAIVAMAKELEWDEPTQGMVLGSFFYGYIATNIPGGRLAEYFGGKIVLTVATLGTACLALVTPVTARYSTNLFVALRICQGLTEGVAFPAMNYFMTRWVPTEEKAKTATRIYTGNMFGTFVTLPVGGWLSASIYGWPSVFYLSGVLGTLLGFIWIWLITDNPEDNKNISDRELSYLLKNCSVKGNEKPIPVPWKEIAKSKQFWFLVLLHGGSNFGFYTLLTQLPTYLVQIIGFELHYAGTIAGATYFASWLFGLIYSTIVTELNLRKKLTVLTVRKMSQIIGSYGNALGFFVLLFVNDMPWAVVTVLIVSGAMNAAVYSGYMVSHSDLSPRFAGTLFGLTNTAASIPGFIAPAIAGALTHNNHTPWAWRWLFIITIALYLICASPYIFFYKAEIEPWNEPQITEKSIKSDEEKAVDTASGKENEAYENETDTRITESNCSCGNQKLNCSKKIR